MKFILIVCLCVVLSTMVRAQGLWDMSPHYMDFPCGYLDAVDENVVWGLERLTTNEIHKAFTRTTDGGLTWTGNLFPSWMNNDLVAGMISAVDASNAWVTMYYYDGVSGGDCGIYHTSNGGTTWEQQSSAAFVNAFSFPNCVHFFNLNEGWCMGDPGDVNYDFEMYTTNNGGATWQLVSNLNIPNSLSSEMGITGYCSFSGDTVWFGTTMGRIFRSPDKGHTWTVSAVTGWEYFDAMPTFCDHLHGMVQKIGTLSDGDLAITSDGGSTWTKINSNHPSSTLMMSSLCFVPGTISTYIGTSIYGTIMKTVDGGYNWTQIDGPYGYSTDWINTSTGFAGGYQNNYRYNGDITGKHDLCGSSLTVSPNPFTNNLSISSYERIDDLSILDLTGKP
ncbi:MAG: WD40/YVTN/BNR-like repeat-containing protein, partial [Syntrophothermus sp.]